MVDMFIYIQIKVRLLHYYAQGFHAKLKGDYFFNILNHISFSLLLQTHMLLPKVPGGTDTEN